MQGKVQLAGNYRFWYRLHHVVIIFKIVVPITSLKQERVKWACTSKCLVVKSDSQLSETYVICVVIIVLDNGQEIPHKAVINTLEVQVAA